MVDFSTIFFYNISIEKEDNSMKLEDRRYEVKVIIDQDFSDKNLCRRFVIYATDVVDACSKINDHMMRDRCYNYGYFGYHIISVVPMDTSDIKVNTEVAE